MSQHLVGERIKKYLIEKGVDEKSFKFRSFVQLSYFSYYMLRTLTSFNLGVVLVLVVSMLFLMQVLRYEVIALLMLLSLPVMFFYERTIIRLAGFITRMLLRESYYGESLARGFFVSRRLRKRYLPIYIDRNVELRNPENIEIGSDSMIYFGAYVLGGKHAGVKIGSRSHIGTHSVLNGNGGIEIGDFCAIAPGVHIYSESNQYKFNPSMKIIDQPIIRQKVKIGNDVWVGANTVILPGVTIGDGTVIGAGAVVTDDIPPNSIAVGAPARIVKKRMDKSA